MGFTLLHRDVDGAGGYRYRQYSNNVIKILEDPSGRAEGKKLSRSSPASIAIQKEIGQWEHSPYAAQNVERIIENQANNAMALARFVGGEGGIRKARITAPGLIEITPYGSPEIRSNYNDHLIRSIINVVPLGSGVLQSVSPSPSGYRIQYKWNPDPPPSEPHTVGGTQPDFLGALAPRQQGYTATDDLWQFRKNAEDGKSDRRAIIGQVPPGKAPLDRAPNYWKMVGALVVGGGGYLFWRGMKKSRGSGARVRVVETGEVLEVDPKSIEISRFAGEEGEFDALTIKRDGQDVLVEMQEVQDDPDPQAAPQAARRMMGRTFSKKPVGSGNTFESMQQSMMEMDPQTTPQEERHFDKLVKKAYSQGGEEVDKYFAEIGF